MKNSFVVFVLLLTYNALGQWTPDMTNVDTIKINHRTGGVIDSFDFSMNRYMSTLPSGGYDLPNLVPDITFFNNVRNGARGYNEISNLKLRNAGLPHVGFAYTFGTKGTSFAQANYQHNLKNKFLINLDYKNDRGNSYLRNAVYRISDLKLSMLKGGSLWRFRLDFYDFSNQSNLNNGIDENTNIVDFPLSFADVQKENAQSKYRTTTLKLQQYFDFNKDSIVGIGLLTYHDLQINSRKYSESDVLSNLYNVINYDSLSTNDFYQLSKISNGIGFFISKNKFHFSSKLTETYWKYFNLGSVHDSLETSIKADLVWSKNQMLLKGEGYFNFLGAGQEWSSSISFVNRFTKVIKLNSYFNVENLWPKVQQRFYNANNINYQLNNYQKQFAINLDNEIDFNLNKIDFIVVQKNSFFNKNYFFDTLTNSWSNTLIDNFSIHQLKVKLNYSYKVLTIQPEYTFTYENKLNNFIPDHYIKLRTIVKGKLFKSKKMLAFVGVDFNYFSKVNLMSFLPVMDTYLYQNTGLTLPYKMNLHLFGGFQIDEFRFFVRYENLNAIWEDPSLELMKAYPIPAGQLNVGITWDFFN